MLFFFFLFLALAAIFSAERNHFSNFGRESPKEYFCEITLKSGHWPRSRCCLKGFFLFLALAAILCSGADQFEQFRLRIFKGTILSTLVEIHPLVTEKMSFEAN